MSTWREIDGALRPIIGQRGVGLLYNRSRHMAGRAYPWLADMQGISQDTMDLEALAAVIVEHEPEQAAAAGGLLLKTFHHLLSSLIGPSLTEQLLRPVWVDFSSGPSTQDIVI